MRSKSFEGMACSIATTLEAVGDRWAMLVLRDLMLGLSRYDDLRKSTDITNATLTDRLRQLEQSGLVERRLYQSGPDRYEYLLTPKGRDLSLVIQALAQVGDRWRLQQKRSRPCALCVRSRARPCGWRWWRRSRAAACPFPSCAWRPAPARTT